MFIFPFSILTDMKVGDILSRMLNTKERASGGGELGILESFSIELGQSPSCTTYFLAG